MANSWCIGKKKLNDKSMPDKTHVIRGGAAFGLCVQNEGLAGIHKSIFCNRLQTQFTKVLCSTLQCLSVRPRPKSAAELRVSRGVRVTASARYTAPRNDATPLLREQSVTFIAPRNTMETIAPSAKSAKFSEEEDELLVFEVQERHILWSLQQKEYKIVLKKDKEWELIGKKLSKTGKVKVNIVLRRVRQVAEIILFVRVGQYVVTDDVISDRANIVCGVPQRISSRTSVVCITFKRH
ncbi:hypothetical protein J6590_036873 [Homalodisca vitripennis]|nr:hypothetical protein J6590_036873 [Homalodisca vitripennis]